MTCIKNLKITDFIKNYSNHRMYSLIRQNAYGGIMGGAIFTLADLAFAALSNNIHQPTVAQQVSINYLSSVKGSRLIARAYIKKDGQRTITINVDVKDDTGRDIAQFIGLGFKL